MTSSPFRTRASLTVAAQAGIDGLLIEATTGGFAVPPMTYAEMRDMLHTAQVGTSIGGSRLTARATLRAEDPQVFTVTVTRQSSTWTCTYMAAPGGGTGRILNVVDKSGKQWAPAPWADSWLDAGVR